MKKHNMGFTLVELMVTLAIFGILASLAVPSISSSINNSRVKSVSNQIHTLIRYSRSEAVRMGTDIMITPINQISWSSGLVSWVDQNGDGLFVEADDLEVRRVQIDQSIDVAESTGILGFPINGKGYIQQPVNFEICSQNVAIDGRDLQVLVSGYSKVDIKGDC